ncbi:hypothetical protein P3T25_007823 [Paraburkholderia sp. GAS32]
MTRWGNSMRNNDSNGFVAAGNAVALACAFAGPVDTSSCPFNKPDPMEEGRRSVSILARDDGSTAAKHHDPRAPMATQDETDTASPGISRTVSKDGGIVSRQRGYMFAMGSGAYLSITGTTGSLDLAERTMPQLPATLALLPAGSPVASMTHP